jgi:hypothetical protein
VRVEERIVAGVDSDDWHDRASATDEYIGRGHAQQEDTPIAHTLMLFVCPPRCS